MALLIAATMMFSVSDMMAKLLSQSLPVIEVVWLRYIPFVAIAVWLDARTGPRRSRARRPALQVVRGLGVVGSAIGFVMALRSMPMADTAAISYVSPAMITLLSVPVLGEKVGWARAAAVAAGLFGVLLVMRPGTSAFQPAALFVVCSSASWSVASVVARMISSVERATTTALWSAVVGLLVLSLIMPAVAVWPTRASGPSGWRWGWSPRAAST